VAARDKGCLWVGQQGGGGLRELRRVGASLCGSIESLVSHFASTLSAASGLTAGAAASKPLQIGHRRIKVSMPQIAGVKTRAREVGISDVQNKGAQLVEYERRRSGSSEVEKSEDGSPRRSPGAERLVVAC